LAGKKVSISFRLFNIDQILLLIFPQWCWQRFGLILVNNHGCQFKRL